MANIARTLTVVAVLAAAVPAGGRADAAISTATLTHPATAARAAATMFDTLARGSAAQVLSSWMTVADMPANAAVAAVGTTGPVADLLGAVERAESLRQLAVADLTRAERDLVLNDPYRVLRPARGPRAAFSSVPGGRVEVRPRVTALADRIDQGAFARAALVIVDAIERAAPALGVIPTDKAVPSGCPGVTGEVVFETEDCNVIVADTGANTYAEPANPTLLIDLGGDDTYTGQTATGLGVVEVVVDVGGNDDYGYTASFTEPGPDERVEAQGFGSLGVGVLADLAGDDSYDISASATAPEPGPVARSMVAAGQGASLLGAGVLIDAGGADTTGITVTSSGGSLAATGQGDGLGGLGALIDLGSESDQRALDVRSTRHATVATDTDQRFTTGAVTASGQGSSAGGLGLLADRDGADDMTASAIGGDAAVVGQGAGLGGVGVAIDGGGGDTSIMHARAVSELEFTGDDESFCWRAGVLAGTNGGSALGQGAALLGAGLHLDAGGNDQRNLEGVSQATATVTIRSAHDCATFGNEAEATASAGPGSATGQGASTGGAAALIDLGGDDWNTLLGHSEADATASATSPGADVAAAEASADDGLAQGQAYGALDAVLHLDVTGDDHYVADTFTSTLETEIIDGIGTGAGSATAGTELIQGYQMEGPLVTWFIDVGGDDTYLSSAGATMAADDSCWSNNPAENDGRGRDLPIGLLPSDCP